MSAVEARRDAPIKLGGLDQTREAYGDRRGLARLDSVWQDIRFGLGMLRKNPGFSAAAILTRSIRAQFVEERNAIPHQPHLCGSD